MPILWGLVVKHWRGFAVALVVVGIVLAILAYGRSRYDAGKTSGKTEQTEQDTQVYKSAISQRDDLLSQSQSQLQEANQRAQQFAQASQVLAGQLATLKIQSDQASRQVAALPDSQLFQDVRAKIGQVSIGDQQPYTPGELRKIDDSITQLPIQAGLVSNLTETVQKKDDQIKAEQDATAAAERQRDTWKQYADTVTQLYVRTYNAIDHHRRSGRCVWLWKCAEKKLDFPSPTSLVAPLVKAAP